MQWYHSSMAHPHSCFCRASWESSLVFICKRLTLRCKRQQKTQKQLEPQFGSQLSVSSYPYPLFPKLINQKDLFRTLIEKDFKLVVSKGEVQVWFLVSIFEECFFNMHTLKVSASVCTMCMRYMHTHTQKKVKSVSDLTIKLKQSHLGFWGHAL